MPFPPFAPLVIEFPTIAYRLDKKSKNFFKKHSKIIGGVYLDVCLCAPKYGTVKQMLNIIEEFFSKFLINDGEIFIYVKDCSSKVLEQFVNIKMDNKRIFLDYNCSLPGIFEKFFQKKSIKLKKEELGEYYKNKQYLLETGIRKKEKKDISKMILIEENIVREAFLRVGHICQIASFANNDIARALSFGANYVIIREDFFQQVEKENFNDILKRRVQIVPNEPFETYDSYLKNEIDIISSFVARNFFAGILFSTIKAKFHLPNDYVFMAEEEAGIILSAQLGNRFGKDCFVCKNGLFLDSELMGRKIIFVAFSFSEEDLEVLNSALKENYSNNYDIEAVFCLLNNGSKNEKIISLF